MTSNLWSKKTYMQDLSFLKSCNIYEYDIQKANISILYHYNKIDLATYEYLKRADNMIRKITIGKMMTKDKNLITTISDGIIEFKRLLFEKYELQDNEILSIKNDAIFTLRELDSEIQFSPTVKFTLRNHYNLFCRIFRLQLFYLFDSVSDKEILHIKGMNDKDYSLHEDYMIDFIKTVFKTYQTDSIEETIYLIRNFYENYINRRYDSGFYRELDSGKIRLSKISNYSNFQTEIVTPQMIPFIDINTNAAVVRELFKIFSTECLRGK